MVRRWFRKTFGPDYSAADRLRPFIKRMAQMDIQRSKPYVDPVLNFMRSLPTEQKARARFHWSAGNWQMSDREKIRVVTLYKQAGWPGMDLSNG
jgi:hypothetical protein